MRAVAFIFVWAGIVACVPDGRIVDFEDDKSMPHDAGLVVEQPDDDGGFVADAGEIIDAGFPDAGFRDSGPPPTPDAGPPFDAGVIGYPAARGPSAGMVLVHGGGSDQSAGIVLFRDLVGRNEPVVVVPTAKTSVSVSGEAQSARNRGFTDVTVLHTRDPSRADQADFVEPLLTAKGVWFTGGRQWRLSDAYLGTRFYDEVRNVLQRGGVLGGTSAGASIMGSFLVRGDTSGNTVVIGDHTEGFGFLTNVGVDQHVAQRGRQTDLFELVEQYPDQLGLGCDEPIGLLFMGDVFEVHGRGIGYVHYRGLWDGAQSERDRYLRLTPGSRFNVRTLSLE